MPLLIALLLAAPPDPGALRQALTRPTRFSVRATLHDDAEATRVQLGPCARGAAPLVVGRFPAEGPPQVWRGAASPDACRRIARQLVSRLQPRAWARALPRLTHRCPTSRDAGAPTRCGDTTLRVATAGATVKVRVAEEDVQEVGFVAVTRGELLMLARQLTSGAIGY